MERLFGTAKKVEEKPKEPTAQDHMMGLQEEIDQMNASIATWQRQQDENKRMALAHKKKGREQQARQLLMQNKVLASQVQTASGTVALLMQKQGSLSVSTMLNTTHSKLAGVNRHLKENTKALDVDEFQDTLAEGEMADEELKELGEYINVANPFNNTRELDDEFDRLGEADYDDLSETDYDFPPVPVAKKQPSSLSSSSKTVATTTRSTTSNNNSPKPVTSGSSSGAAKKRSVIDDLF